MADVETPTRMATSANATPCLLTNSIAIRPRREYEHAARSMVELPAVAMKRCRLPGEIRYQYSSFQLPRSLQKNS